MSDADRVEGLLRHLPEELQPLDAEQVWLPADGEDANCLFQRRQGDTRLDYYLVDEGSQQESALVISYNVGHSQSAVAYYRFGEVVHSAMVPRTPDSAAPAEDD